MPQWAAIREFYLNVMTRFWDEANKSVHNSEGTTGRALPNGLAGVPPAEMTVAKCISGCNAAGNVFAGVEYGGECCKCEKQN